MLTVGAQIVIQDFGLIRVHCRLAPPAAQFVADMDQCFQTGVVDADHFILADRDVIAFQQILYRFRMGFYRQYFVSVADHHRLPAGQNDLGVTAHIVADTQRVAVISEVGIAVHQCDRGIGDHQIGIGLCRGIRHAPRQAQQQRQHGHRQPAHPYMLFQAAEEAAQKLVLRQFPDSFFGALPPGAGRTHHAGVEKPRPHKTPHQRQYIAKTPPEYTEGALQCLYLAGSGKGPPAVPHMPPGKLDVWPKLL